MGNNPSRTHAHHHHQHQHHQQQHSTPTSPPTANVPARAASTSSSRTRIDRRNSLQQVPAARHPTSSASVPPEDPLLPVRPRNDPTSSSESRYISQGPRERIAEAISSTPWTINNARNSSGFHRVDDEDEDDEMLTSPISRNHPTVPTNPTPAAGGDLPSRLGTPPADVAEPHADPAALTKRGSMGSTTTVDEDEVDVADTRTIPTLIQWSQPGHKVCVTGTFSNWRRRFKLSRSSESEPLSAVVPLPPGTHHLKFFVDGEMRTSDDLPTAVDDTGILVNYLEVNADDMPPLDRQSSLPSPTGSHRRPTASANLLTTFSKKNKRYTNEIPAYLREFDDSYDDNCRRIGSGDGDIPVPPSLPMMLQKVILNTNSTKKDDASVLGIPNHVVLNHLATSSIKNQVLAVSATTRYRKKYVTTILYKATTE